jgi:hypothetical protein
MSLGLRFVFKELLSGIQKGKTVLNPKFVNGFFIQGNRAPSVDGCMCSRAVHTVECVGTWLLTMPILTTKPQTPLLSVSKFLASVALYGIRNVWVNWDPLIHNMDECR